MKRQGNTIAAKYSEYASTITGFRRYFAAMMLSFMVLIAGSAQADPSGASLYLQSVKSDYYIAKLNFQIGKNYVLAGKPSVAKQYFISANIKAIYLKSNATSLYYQNVDTLDRGLYRNAYYQQQAIFYSTQLQYQMQLLSVHLSILSQQPQSVSSRVNAEIAMLQIDQILLSLEQSMYLAQI